MNDLTEDTLRELASIEITRLLPGIGYVTPSVQLYILEGLTKEFVAHLDSQEVVN